MALGPAGGGPYRQVSALADGSLAQATALVELVDRIPEELLVVDSRDYARIHIVLIQIRSAIGAAAGDPPKSRVP